MRYRFDVEAELRDWGLCTEKMLVQSSIGFRGMTSEAVMMQHGGEIIASTRKRDYSPNYTLPKRVHKVDRILRAQPVEFLRLAEQKYVLCMPMREIAEGRNVSISKVNKEIRLLHARIDGAWRVLRAAPEN